jgi:hypothetical protein
LVLDKLWPDLFPPGSRKRLPHFAPEPFFERRFRDASEIDYLSADLCYERATVWMDVSRIPHAGEIFSVIFCCHVLEHVVDDQEAIAELYRILEGGPQFCRFPSGAPTHSTHRPA